MTFQQQVFKFLSLSNRCHSTVGKLNEDFFCGKQCCRSKFEGELVFDSHSLAKGCYRQC